MLLRQFIIVIHKIDRNSYVSHLSTIFSLLINTLDQWFLTLLQVLNPTSSIYEFIEPFVVGAFFSSNAKHVYMYITIHCISAQTSGVNQTGEPLKLTHRIPGVRSNPG